MSRLKPLLIALFALVLWSPASWSGTARAADLHELVDQLASDDFDEKATAIEALGALGDSKAVPALRALADGTLYATTDKHAVFAEQDGDNYKLTDPIDGSDKGTATDDDIDKVRVNNRLRSAVLAALGRLTLLSDKRDERLTAAREALNHPTPEGTPALVAALAR